MCVQGAVEWLSRQLWINNGCMNWKNVLVASFTYDNLNCSVSMEIVGSCLLWPALPLRTATRTRSFGLLSSALVQSDTSLNLSRTLSYFTFVGLRDECWCYRCCISCKVGKSYDSLSDCMIGASISVANFKCWYVYSLDGWVAHRVDMTAQTLRSTSICLAMKTELA